MKVQILGKEVEGDLTDSGMIIFGRMVVGKDGVLFDEAKMTSEVNSDMLVAELDKHAMAIKISDKIDGYHSMNKTAKIQAINENR